MTRIGLPYAASKNKMFSYQNLSFVKGDNFFLCLTGESCRSFILPRGWAGFEEFMRVAEIIGFWLDITFSQPSGGTFLR